MSSSGRWMRGATAALFMAVAAVTWAAPAQAPRLAALSRIEAVQWTLRERGPSSAVRTLCVASRASAERRLQLRHPGRRCSRLIVTDTPSQATVQYSCPGAGQGRTTLSVQTPRSITIETQAVADGLPLKSEFSAHRTAACQR